MSWLVLYLNVSLVKYKTHKQIEWIIQADHKWIIDAWKTIRSLFKEISPLFLKMKTKIVFTCQAFKFFFCSFIDHWVITLSKHQDISLNSILTLWGDQIPQSSFTQASDLKKKIVLTGWCHCKTSEIKGFPYISNHIFSVTLLHNDACIYIFIERQRMASYPSHSFKINLNKYKHNFFHHPCDL